MGTWDTSLYGGDLPLDIKAEYYEQLYEGHTPEEAIRNGVDPDIGARLFLVVYILRYSAREVNMR